MLKKFLYTLFALLFAIQCAFSSWMAIEWYKAKNTLEIQPIDVVRVAPISEFMDQFNDVDNSARWMKEFAVISPTEKNGPVAAISESPDRKQVLVVYANGTVLRWDIEKHTVLSQFTVTGAPMKAMFSTDGSRLLIPGGDMKGYEVWDTDQGNIVYCELAPNCPYEFQFQSEWKDDLYLSPNGKMGFSVDNGGVAFEPFGYENTDYALHTRVTWCNDLTVLKDGWQDRLFIGLHKISLSPSQQYIAYAVEYGDICIFDLPSFIHWDPETGQQLFSSPRKWQHHAIPGAEKHTRVRDLKFAPQNRWLAALTDYSLTIWDLTDAFAAPKVSEKSPSPNTVMTFSRSGHTLIVGGQNGLRFYDYLWGNPAVFFIETASVTALYVSQDNQLLIWGDDDGNIHLWSH